MSTLKVDTITDSAGTGAPSFTYGAQIFVPSASGADADTNLTTSSSRLQRLSACTAVRTYKLPSTGIKAGDRWTFVNNATAANSAYVLITAADNSVVGVCHTGGNVTEIMALSNDPGTQSSWLVMRMKEYVSTGGTWTGNVTANLYGPLGTTMSGALSGTVSKVCDFIKPALSGDLVELQISDNQTVWTTAANGSLAGIPLIRQLNTAATEAASSGYYTVITATNVTVLFYRYLAIANDDTPVLDWPANRYWRVVKVTG